jgi:hypothetical protein
MTCRESTKLSPKPLHHVFCFVIWAFPLVNDQFEDNNIISQVVLTSRSAVVSKESSIAFATVPVAINPLDPFRGDHATVAERLACKRRIMPQELCQITNTPTIAGSECKDTWFGYRETGVEG